MVRGICKTWNSINWNLFSSWKLEHLFYFDIAMKGLRWKLGCILKFTITDTIFIFFRSYKSFIYKGIWCVVEYIIKGLNMLAIFPYLPGSIAWFFLLFYDSIFSYFWFSVSRLKTTKKLKYYYKVIKLNVILRFFYSQHFIS